MQVRQCYYPTPLTDYPIYCLACKCGHADLDHGDIHIGFRYPSNTLRGLWERFKTMGAGTVLCSCKYCSCTDFENDPDEHYVDPVKNPGYIRMCHPPKGTDSIRAIFGLQSDQEMEEIVLGA